MAIARLQEMLGDLSGKTIGLLGLSFKPNTDDMRDAPSIDIARSLIAAGATVRAYDPVAMDVARTILPEVTLAPDAYTLAEGCDALVVVTEWKEFKHLDLAQVHDLLRQPVIFDGRNIYDADLLRENGFHYRGVVRGYNGSKLTLEVEPYQLEL